MVCLGSRGPPGGPRRPREGPRIAQGGLPGASRGPGARVKKPRNPYFLRGPKTDPDISGQTAFGYPPRPLLSHYLVPPHECRRWAARFWGLPGRCHMASNLRQHAAILHCSVNLAVHWQFGIRIFRFFLVFGRFSAKLGPKTPLERRGSSCSAGCTKNQPPRPILRPFRGNSEF